MRFATRLRLGFSVEIEIKRVVQGESVYNKERAERREKAY